MQHCPKSLGQQAVKYDLARKCCRPENTMKRKKQPVAKHHESPARIIDQTRQKHINPAGQKHHEAWPDQEKALKAWLKTASYSAILRRREEGGKGKTGESRSGEQGGKGAKTGKKTCQKEKWQTDEFKITRKSGRCRPKRPSAPA